MLEEEVLDLFDRCSNAGRWGQDDERGTLNYITPAMIAWAAGLVRSGITFALGHTLDDEASPKNPVPLVHRMLYASHTDPFACVDVAEIAPHGWWQTHLDAIGHIYFEGQMWNGRRASSEVRSDGMHFGSIMAAASGVVTRGVLLDVPRARGVQFLTEHDVISVADLEAAERIAGITVGEGDALIVRSGLEAREVVQGVSDPERTCGLLPECIPWLFERRVAVYGGDCADKEPTGYPRLPKPLHQVGLVAMGLSMLDNVGVEPLADYVAREGRYEFLLVVAPLPIPRATGSVVNPIAIF